MVSNFLHSHRILRDLDDLYLVRARDVHETALRPKQVSCTRRVDYESITAVQRAVSSASMTRGLGSGHIRSVYFGCLRWDTISSPRVPRLIIVVVVTAVRREGEAACHIVDIYSSSSQKSAQVL